MNQRQLRQLALQDLRDQVWQLRDPDDLRPLLAAAWRCLEALGLPFRAGRVDLNGSSAWGPCSCDLATQAECPYPPAAAAARTDLALPLDGGALVLTRAGRRRLSPAQAGAAGEVARILSGGLARLADLQRLADHARQLEEKDRLLTAYQEIGAITLGSLDLDEILDNLAESIVAAGIFRSMMISLVDETDQSVRVVRYVFGGGPQRGNAPRIAVRSPQGVVGLKYHLDEDSARGEAARTGQVRILDEHGEAGTGGPSPRSGTASCFIPVTRGDRVLAVLTVFCRADERDDLLRRVEGMRPLLDQVAVALEHARLYREAEQARREAQEARQVAEQASRAKSDFLATMSHEIRTPIHAIIGMAELLAGLDDGPERHEPVEAIRTSAESLRRIVDDLLDLARIEAGRLGLESAPFALRRSLAEVVQPFRLKCAQAGVELRCELEPDVPDDLLGDALRLRQILVNLLSNAVKFTPRGAIEVTVARADPTELGSSTALPAGGVGLRFRVRDTGIGIPAGRIGAIFDSFTQADSSTTRRYGGSGLGLAIAAQLVQLMGGRIWVESEEGVGSTFHFTAAFGPAASPGALEPEPGGPGQIAATRADGAPLAPVRILLVEDLEIGRRAAAGLLARDGHAVTAVESGAQALAALKAGTFDLVLMDVEMPDMDGLQTTAAIRAQEEGVGGHVPIIGLTAHTQPGDRQRCLRAGMDGYVPKPMRLGELRAAIRQVLAAPAGGAVEEVRADLAAALELLGGDRQLLADLIGLFLDESPDRLADIREALEQGQAEALAAAAHALKGMLRTLGLSRAADRAEGLRQAALSGQLEPARQQAEALEAQLQRVRPGLAAARAGDGP